MKRHKILILKVVAAAAIILFTASSPAAPAAAAVPADQPMPYTYSAQINSTHSAQLNTAAHSQRRVVRFDCYNPATPPFAGKRIPRRRTRFCRNLRMGIALDSTYRVFLRYSICWERDSTRRSSLTTSSGEGKLCIGVIL